MTANFKGQTSGKLKILQPKLSSLRVRRRIVERNMLTINTRGQSNKKKADRLP